MANPERSTSEVWRRTGGNGEPWPYRPGLIRRLDTDRLQALKTHKTVGASGLRSDDGQPGGRHRDGKQRSNACDDTRLVPSSGDKSTADISPFASSPAAQGSTIYVRVAKEESSSTFRPPR
ncbi:hypothetical protein HPB47_005354 [Ixodes persulcatus]|uniref:Uncharacterized protein n=1 Tax=Ixodes persulcatus TaxID=34615 RepID=A0AC60PD79_IXOPE|nr:hypothetical protein HPB47_005354 [Ixodes persulcatus]